MNKILVTGGAGFIGSKLCEHLLMNGYKVVCLDNFSTGHMYNIQHLIDGYPNRFALIKGDIRNFETCIRAVDGVDFVFHEAALGSIPRSIEDPITTNDVNVGGFLNMLVAARDIKLKDLFLLRAVRHMGIILICQNLKRELANHSLLML